MADVMALWPWFGPLMGAILGAVIGSFAGCMAYRIPRELSVRNPPSSCPSCNTVLGVPDLVPVVSYLALRGKCRFCHVPIPLRSLILEVGFAGLGASIMALLNPSPWAWAALALGLGLATWLAIRQLDQTAWPTSHRRVGKTRQKKRFR